MTTLTATYGIVENALDTIDSEIAEQERFAAEAKARRESAKSKKPLFLWLKQGYTATVRPVHDLKIVLMKHSRWNSDPKLTINALCLQQFGMPCELCKQAAEEDDKKFKAQKYFYLPVWVHAVLDTSGNPVTYEQSNEDGTKTSKPVNGFRVIEMTSSGVIKKTLGEFRAYAVDPDYKGLTGSNFLWGQIGSGQDKDYSLRAKPPVVMAQELKAATPPLERFLEEIIERLTPETMVPAETSVPSTPAPSKGVDFAALKARAQKDVSTPIDAATDYTEHQF